MKTYEVIISTTVQAENEDDAIRIAANTMGCTEVRELEGWDD